MAPPWWVERKQEKQKARAEGAMGRGGSDALPELAVTIRNLRPAPGQAAAWSRLWQRLLEPLETNVGKDASGQGGGDVDSNKSGNE
jgi:hypothetical protein